MRYSTAAAVRSELQQLKRETESGQITQTTTAPVPVLMSEPVRSSRGYGWKKWPASAALLVVFLAVAGFFYNTRHARALGQADTIILADFSNKTGDAIFDDTLRQGLAAQLQQSPFLSLVSEQRIQQTLRLMGRPPESKLTPAIVGDICQ